jgi:hypothetical protein
MLSENPHIVYLLLKTKRKRNCTQFPNPLGYQCPENPGIICKKLEEGIAVEVWDFQHCHSLVLFLGHLV